jgi:hypothetical protein
VFGWSLFELKVVQCNRLRRIAIPASVEVIGSLVFSGCRSLETGTFEAGSVLQEIRENAFAGSGLKSIVIPALVYVIGEGAFRECETLASMTFEAESNLRTIGDSAFEGCPCAGGLALPSGDRETSKSK